MSDRDHRLFSLLAEEGKELDNLKFFPGYKRVNRAEFLDAAAEMVEAANKIEGSTPFPDAHLTVQNKKVA